MKILTNSWRRTSLAIATFAAMGMASAQEETNTLGTLLLDPEFEESYIDAVSRTLEDARINADNGLSGPSLSIENLRQDPDFDDALNRRVEDVIEEKLFERQIAGTDDENQLDATLYNAATRSLSPRSADTLRFDALAPYAAAGLVASLFGDSCHVNKPFTSPKLWANGDGTTVADAESAAGRAAEKAAASHVAAIIANPGMYCPSRCPEGSVTKGPTPNPAKGAGVGHQSIADIGLGIFDAVSLPWYRTYYASASWSVSGEVFCFGKPKPAVVTATPNITGVKTPGSLVGK